MELRFHGISRRSLVLVFHFFFLSLSPSVSNTESRGEEKTDRRGNTVCGSAAAAYQDAVVNVSEIIMWCDVSQVSFARGSAAHRSLTHARRPAAVLFSRNPLSPPRAHLRSPVRAFPSFGFRRVRHACPRFRVSRRSWRAGYVIARAVPRLSKNDDRERAGLV